MTRVRTSSPPPFPRRLSPRSGAALVESAVMLPLLLMIILNTANFGLYIIAHLTVANAARTAATYCAYSTLSIESPTAPTYSQIQTVVNNDSVSLRGYAAGTNPTLRICRPVSGTVTCTGTGVLSAPSDPGSYSLCSAEVSYTFSPLFSAFTLPVIHVPLTIPATAVRRQVAMRIMQ